MGVGYQVSPLCRIPAVDWSAVLPSADVRERPVPLPPPGRMIPFEAVERHLRSAAKADIIAWRTGFAARYRDELRGPLDWDEDSAFIDSDEVATHSDVLLRYVAALLDQSGEDATARFLTGRPDVSISEMGPRLAEIERGGSGGRFPQLLLGCSLWLPFEADRVIAAPDWAGRTQQFGSVRPLTAELEAVRYFIVRAEPGATAVSRDQDDPPTVFGRVWQCSETVSRLARGATRQQLPLWTTG